MPRRRKEGQQAAPRLQKLKGGYVPVRWEGVEQATVLYANQIFVHFEDGQFLITFGHGKLPFEVPFTQATFDRLKETGVPVYAVARILVTAERLGVMLQTLADFHKQHTGAKPKVASKEASNA